MKRYLEKRRNSKKKRTMIVLMAIVVLGLVFAILQTTRVTHFFAEEKATSGTIPSSKPQTKKETASSDKNTTVPSSGASSSPEDPKLGDATTQPAPNGAAPVAPFGNFVSNHDPNLSGKPTPSSEQSVCNTTPGASCYIQFTNSQGIVKRLAAQTTDGNGATYWNWDVKQAGLTTGTWTINVIATLNGKTSSTQDARNLQVNP